MYANDICGKQLADLQLQNAAMSRGNAELELLECDFKDPLDADNKLQAGWNRVRWSEHASRIGVDLARQQFPPCHRWFPHDTWPTSLQGPPEGSLDKRSARRLVDILRKHGADEYTAAYGLLAYGFLESTPRCFRGPVEDLFMVGSGPAGTPSNIWPPDRSWFVYTDYDLWGTRVNGPIQLIEALKADEELETIDWRPLTDNSGVDSEARPEVTTICL